MMVLPSPPVSQFLRVSELIVQFWLDNVTDQWALEVIQKGYCIDFLELPPVTIKPKFSQTKSDQEHQVAMSEIQELLAKGAIEQVNPEKTPGFYSTLFIIPKKGGGTPSHFEFAPSQSVCGLSQVQNGDKSNYLTRSKTGGLVSFAGSEGRLLPCSDTSFTPALSSIRLRRKVYQFKVLPFGLSSAPRVFTKMLAPIVTLIHLRGIRFHPYLDDCLLIASNPKVL